MAPELKAHLPLSEAMHQWYKDSYGDRLKVDPCPGRTVVLLDGDLYVLKVPRIYGAANFRFHDNSAPIQVSREDRPSATSFS